MSGRAVTWSVAVTLVVGLAACGSTPARTGGTGPPTSPSVTASAPGSTTGTPTPPSPVPSPSRSAATQPTGGGPASTASPPPVPQATTTPTPTPTPRRTVPFLPTPSHTSSRSVVHPAPNACVVTAKYRGRDLEVVPTAAKIAVLTFDGGASSTGVASILSTLATTKTAATFFLTGDFTRDHPTSTARIAAAHPVGNHTNTHPDLTTLSSTAVVDQVRRGAAVIRAGTGRPPGPWFRFPYGARDARTIGLVNDECYVAVRWTVDSLGWKGTSGGMTVAKVRDRVLGAARPGMVVLMHVGANPDDGTTLDAAALPAIVAGLRAKGYSFVTLQQAL
jgi:peptidoglycan/xylan/chitin deacetylase (PgdA/CDA1 family)